MRKNMTPEEAKRVVTHLVDDAKRQALRDYEAALYQIVHLPWWKCWRAKDIADRALGTGKYWNHW